MNADHEAFCLTDPTFYDVPAAATDDASLLVAIERAVPDGWVTTDAGVWTVVHRPEAPLPTQGWKIHVSACLANALRVLRTTFDHCIEHDLCFKFLGTQAAFLAKNAKYANRSGSGKFVTIYPTSDADLERTLVELGAALDGEAGPYILSDLRWADGPLHVRYGGFVARECRDEHGATVPAIERPDGELVPDLREPRFVLPDWVEVPECLADAVAERTAGSDETLPYDILEALHFSNGGGVYLATDPISGGKVVLKEARPHAGIDGDGADAVTRLDHEHRILERLAGLDCVPAVLDSRSVWEHRFLVEEHVEGATVAEELAQRHPLISADPDPVRIEAYTAWAVGVIAGVDAAVAAVHERGVVIADLHPRNIIVRPDGSICLIDLELGHLVDEPFARSLGANGFAAPADRTGFAIDRYALGALRLALFLPFVELLSWDAGKVDELIDAVEARFAVPAGYGARVRADLGTVGDSTVAPAWRDELWPRTGLPRWDAVRRSITAGIDAAATPERRDRLFPGDPAQFSTPTGGLGMAFGAAGVLWAQREVGSPVRPEHLDWLVAQTTSRGDIPSGFSNGLAGIAYALDTCGRPDDALVVLDRLLTGPVDADDLSFDTGLAGIALTLLHFHGTTGDVALLELATQLAEHAIVLLEQQPDRLTTAGLLHGWSGPALLWLRLHELVDDPTLLDAAVLAVRRDLARCVRTDSGSLQVDDDWRVLPYLAVGSAGIGLVLQQLVAALGSGDWSDDVPADLLDALDGIRIAATGDVVIQPGLFSGRAGLTMFLRGLHPVPSAAVEAHVTALGWHAAPFEGHLAFVGDQLARLSMDLATGSAGVLLALGAALGERPLGLPFLRLAPGPHRSDASPAGVPAGPRPAERR